MRYKTFAMLLAATLLAGSVHYARAVDEPMPFDDPEVTDEMDIGDDDLDAWSPAFRPRRPGDHPGFPRDWRGPGRHRGPDFRHPGFDDHRGPGPRHFSMARQFRDHGMGRHGFGPGMGMGVHILDQLELTDTQKSQMIDLMTNNYRAKLEARLELAQAERKMRELRDNDSATADDIVAANTELGAARGKLEAISIKFKQDARHLLTPEQIKKIEDRMSGPRGEPRKDIRRPGRDRDRDRGPDGRRGDRRPDRPRPGDAQPPRPR